MSVEFNIQTLYPNGTVQSNQPGWFLPSTLDEALRFFKTEVEQVLDAKGNHPDWAAAQVDRVVFTWKINEPKDG